MTVIVIVIVSGLVVGAEDRRTECSLTGSSLIVSYSVLHVHDMLLSSVVNRIKARRRKRRKLRRKQWQTVSRIEAWRLKKTHRPFHYNSVSEYKQF